MVHQTQLQDNCADIANHCNKKILQADHGAQAHWTAKASIEHEVQRRCHQLSKMKAKRLLARILCLAHHAANCTVQDCSCAWQRWRASQCREQPVNRQIHSATDLHLCTNHCIRCLMCLKPQSVCDGFDKAISNHEIDSQLNFARAAAT